MFKIHAKKLAVVICTLAMMSTCILPAFAASSFPDVPSSHWSYPYVSAAVEEGLVRGFPDGKFHPNDEVTYAQFITIVAQAYYVIPKGTASTPWYQVYVDALNQDNLLAGTAAESSIGKPISRYEMAQIAGNVLADADIEAGAEQLQKAQAKFTDWGSIPEQYKKAVALCYANKVLSGLPDGSFGGGQTMTRAQACSVIIRVLDCLKGSTPPSTQPSVSKADPAEVIRLINAERAKKGLGELKTLDSLTKAAQMRAEDISQGYINNRPDGSDWDSVLTTAGVTAKVDVINIDESIAGGTTDATQVLHMLQNTNGARDALANGKYDYVGVGYAHTDKPYSGYNDFWSILYIEPSGSAQPGSGNAQSAAGDFKPVPIDQLANRKSLQKKATNEQFAQAYAEAAKIVAPLANLSREQQLQGIAKALRTRFDSGMSYSMSSAHYNDPYGYLIEGSASCAGCTRATGLCLNILGIEYEHVNENQYSHQWCRVNIDGVYWICDAYGLYVGPEPAPYQHPYF